MPMKSNEEIVPGIYVANLIKRAREAQKIADSFSQDRVDELSTAVAWAAVKEENARALAKLAFEETQLGDFESKIKKIQKKIKGVQRDIKNMKSVGIIETDSEKGIIKIAKPVGIIGALIPVTNPEVTPCILAINAIKGRNAVVYSPHPRSKNTTFRTVDLLRHTLKRHNAPEDLLICADIINKEISNEIMRQCDLVIATGGAEMVKAAYGSGKPAYGVGAGNAVIIVDETADISSAANKIMLSKTFDLASGCSCENSLVIKDSIYEDFLIALQNEGGYITNPEEKKNLQRVMWTEGHINSEIIAKPADKIASLAKINLPVNSKFIVVEEEGIGKDYPFSGEKLSIVLTVYKYHDFEEAIQKVNKIQEYQGAGHSCGIHSFNEDHIIQLCLNTKTSRVMVRQPHIYGNSGDWGNGMPFTVSLGCGTWGGNIVSENITLKHYINTTWVSYPIEPIIPTDEELFGEIMIED
jgi:sulfoacetaldehyde dehydrogenase